MTQSTALDHKKMHAAIKSFYAAKEEGNKQEQNKEATKIWYSMTQFIKRVFLKSMQTDFFYQHEEDLMTEAAAVLFSVLDKYNPTYSIATFMYPYVKDIAHRYTAEELSQGMCNKKVIWYQYIEIKNLYKEKKGDPNCFRKIAKQLRMEEKTVVRYLTDYHNVFTVSVSSLDNYIDKSKPDKNDLDELISKQFEKQLTPSAEDIVLAKINNEHLYRCINRLPEAERKIIIAYLAIAENKSTIGSTKITEYLGHKVTHTEIQTAFAMLRKKLNEKENNDEDEEELIWN